MHDAAREVLLEDPILEPIVRSHEGVTVEPAPDPFARLVVSIVRQQVSMDSAAAIRKRLFDAVEVTPAGIQGASTETLESVGLSEAKTEYVKAAARYFQDIDDGYFRALDDEAVLNELLSIRGIGPWTGKMFLIFGLGREDVFPVEDLGIRKGMRSLYDGDLDREEMYERADQWRPYRSYGTMCIWQGYED